jgi:hypothetical protein
MVENEKEKIEREAAEKAAAEEEARERAKNADAGKQPEGENSMIEDANKAAERLEKANAEQKTLLDRQDATEARLKLGGQSSAGGQLVVKTEDEKWAEEAKERYAGTGLDPTEDNSPTVYA